MDISNQIVTEEKEVNVLHQLVSKYLPYWPLFLVLILFSIGGAFVYLRYATPIYESSATLIIKDESKGGSEDSYITESLNLIASKKNIENETQVLKSRGLMERVVKVLSLYAPVMEVGKFKEGDGYVISPIVIEALNTDSMKEVQKVFFSFDKKGQNVIINKHRYPLNEFVSTPFGMLKFKTNKYAQGTTYDIKKPLYFSLDNPGNAAGKYSGGLKITPNKLSAIVDISYRDPVPQRAVDIINELITVYDLVSIDEKNRLARNTLAFVNEQLRALTGDLDSIESRVQHYKSGSGAVDISSQGRFYLENVSSNDRKLGDINMQISILGEIEKSVYENQSSELLAPSVSGIGDPSLSNLVGQLQSAEIEYEKLKKSVGKNNPSLIALEDQISKLRPAILESIKSQKKVLEASRQSLSSTNTEYSSVLSAVPQKERQLLEISRAQLTKNSQYQFLLQKKQEAEMSLASVVSNSRVVDKAVVNTSPISPKKSLVYMMALMIAMGLGVGLVFARDAFTSKIKFRSEIERMTTIPIIGEIAYEKTKSPIVIQKGTRSFIAEEFRKLRISLAFLGIDNRNRKILFTSSISGEGKSFIAANLALSISMIGKKVVLVDLDLNQPTLSDILDVEFETGVTEYLTGEKQAEEIIQKLDNHENLYFIPPGTLPENPSELLANGRVKYLIEYLDNNFDMVIIDTSPAVLVTDAYILSALCNATLYVMRHNFTPKLLVRRIDETVLVNPLNNPAIVFNGIKRRGVFKNNYGYGNNYVYGGKYGNKHADRMKKKKSKKAS